MFARQGILWELWYYLRERRKFWLLPVMLLMVLIGSLLALAQGSALAPFIYSVF